MDVQQCAILILFARLRVVFDDFGGLGQQELQRAVHLLDQTGLLAEGRRRGKLARQNVQDLEQPAYRDRVVRFAQHLDESYRLFVKFDFMRLELILLHNVLLLHPQVDKVDAVQQVSVDELADARLFLRLVDPRGLRFFRKCLHG